MTVQKLIDALWAVEDKTLPVQITDYRDEEYIVAHIEVRGDRVELGATADGRWHEWPLPGVRPIDARE